jgi:type I restriction enzyme R subunit
MTTEEKARVEIDGLLAGGGWVVQGENSVNFATSHGVAVGEMSKTDKPDCIFIVDGCVIGVMENSPHGFLITDAEVQSEKYLAGTPLGIPHWGDPLPFSQKLSALYTCQLWMWGHIP